jgi:hypothetical protein
MERKELNFLEQLVRFIEAKAVVEVGVQFGDTTVHLCRAAINNGGKYAGFDIWNADEAFLQRYGNCGSKEIVSSKLKSNGLNEFILTQIDTMKNKALFEEKLTEIFPNGIDFAFIDGNHSYAGIASDFFTIYPRLTPAGVIAFHDTTRIDGCREFVFDLRTKYNDGTFDISDFPYGYGERRCGVTLLTKRYHAVLSIGIDEVCGSLSTPDDIEVNEFKWIIEEELKNQKPMPKAFDKKILVDKLGYYPQRLKYARV